MINKGVLVRIEPKMFQKLEVEARREKKSIPELIRKLISERFRRKEQYKRTSGPEWAGPPRRKIRTWLDEFSVKRR